MFNSQSGWGGNAAMMRATTETSMKTMLFDYSVQMCNAKQFCGGVAPSRGGGSMCTSGSENLDYDAKSSCYIALRELSKFPEFKDRLLESPPPPPPPPPSPSPPGPPRLPRCNSCCKAGCGLMCCSSPPPADRSAAAWHA